MADFRAVAAVSEAVIELPQANYLAAPRYFNNELEFKIYFAKDFSQPIGGRRLAVSLPHLSQRHPSQPARAARAGRAAFPQPACSIRTFPICSMPTRASSFLPQSCPLRG